MGPRKPTGSTVPVVGKSDGFLLNGLELPYRREPQGYKLNHNNEATTRQPDACSNFQWYVFYENKTKHKNMAFGIMENDNELQIAAAVLDVATLLSNAPQEFETVFQHSNDTVNEIFGPMRRKDKVCRVPDCSWRPKCMFQHPATSDEDGPYYQAGIRCLPRQFAKKSISFSPERQEMQQAEAIPGIAFISTFRKEEVVTPTGGTPYPSSRCVKVDWQEPDKEDFARCWVTIKEDSQLLPDSLVNRLDVWDNFLSRAQETTVVPTARTEQFGSDPLRGSNKRSTARRPLFDSSDDDESVSNSLARDSPSAEGSLPPPPIPMPLLDDTSSQQSVGNVVGTVRSGTLGSPADHPEGRLWTTTYTPEGQPIRQQSADDPLLSEERCLHFAYIKRFAESKAFCLLAPVAARTTTDEHREKGHQCTSGGQTFSDSSLSSAAEVKGLEGCHLNNQGKCVIDTRSGQDQRRFIEETLCEVFNYAAARRVVELRSMLPDNIPMLCTTHNFEKDLSTLRDAGIDPAMFKDLPLLPSYQSSPVCQIPSRLLRGCLHSNLGPMSDAEERRLYLSVKHCGTIEEYHGRISPKVNGGNSTRPVLNIFSFPKFNVPLRHFQCLYNMTLLSLTLPTSSDEVRENWAKTLRSANLKEAAGRYSQMQRGMRQAYPYAISVDPGTQGKWPCVGLELPASCCGHQSDADDESLRNPNSAAPSRQQPYSTVVAFVGEKLSSFGLQVLQQPTASSGTTRSGGTAATNPSDKFKLVACEVPLQSFM